MLSCQRSLFDLPSEVCYLNAAAWSPLPREAVAVGRDGAALKARPWTVAPDLAATRQERARLAGARLIGARPEDVALVSSVSYGVAVAGRLFPVPPGQRVLILAEDHSSPTLEWLSRARSREFSVETVHRRGSAGWTESLLEAIERPGAPAVAMVSISSVHWADGGVVDLQTLRTALRASGAGLLVDATHSAGVVPMDVSVLDPDFVIFPTYKWLLGPYSRAFLYVAPRWQEGVPLEQTSYGRRRVNSLDAVYFSDLDYVEGARRFDMGERDHFYSLPAACVGMELLLGWGVSEVGERIAALVARIAEGLAGRPGVNILPGSVRSPNVLSVSVDGGLPPSLTARLEAEQVYVVERLGRLRISPHVYNDEADCDRLVEALERHLA